MEQFLNFLQQILSTPSILVGLIALIGLVAQKKPIEVVIKGTIKTILGFIVIGAGANVLVGALNYFGNLFNFAFAVQGVVPNNEAIVSLALNTYAKDTAIIMALGMVANLLLARFSRMKYIFLTGHHTLYMAALIAVVLTVGGLESGSWQLYVGGSMLLGLTMVFFPAIAQKTMVKITGDDSIAFGHFGTLGYVFAAWIGSLVGKGSKSTEDIKFPKRLSFLRDTSVAISLTMFIFFVLVTFAAVIKPDFDATVLGGTHWFLFSIIQSLTFAAGVYVVLAGVRLVLAEIVPAFKGISEKIVPDAKPALDCPVVFPYAENAVLLGFLVSFAGGLVGLAILFALQGTLNPALILPGVIPHFFCGATSGVFGNATGGRRGAILGAFGHGLLITFLPAMLMPVMGSLGFANTTFSDADFTAVGILIGNIANFVKGTGLLAVCVGLFVLPIVYNVVAPKKAKS
ncbi:MAG: PTS ascorbate transporter subunit IIC [Firmicutes bacterium GWF2_51_9]|nr:MAG: PTS ascorbate transporter subunit IIC [Firmicutes bacterium GWF2_51_9]OGS59715.1 MAG: PTS ascorbate transporter subunit IIC [Firmicutes bacterium GWE2_51_13]HAM64070.1 PTS ascorbate transporter subunit IIC [Erysipelotrichaceae bacterium]